MAQMRVGRFEDLVAKLEKAPEFREEYRQLRPYYDLVVEIIRRRNELNLTQEQLAERAGMRQSCISRLESAEHNTRLATLIKVAEALEANLEIRLTPIFYVEDRDYIKLCDLSASISPAQEHIGPIVEQGIVRV